MSEFKLSALMADEAEVSLEMGGATVELAYRPQVFTLAFLDGVLETPGIALDEALLHVVAKWNLVDDRPPPPASASAEPGEPPTAGKPARKQGRPGGRA